MQLENILPSEVTQSQLNTHGIHTLRSGNLAKSFEYLRKNSHMKLEKKADEKVNPSFLLGRKNKILRRGSTETKSRDGTEKKVIRDCPTR